MWQIIREHIKEYEILNNVNLGDQSWGIFKRLERALWKWINETIEQNSASDLEIAFKRLNALIDARMVEYNLFLENDGTSHTCELGNWGWEAGQRDELATGCGDTPAQAIIQAIDSWERGERTYAPILTCVLCGKIHLVEEPCPSSKKED